LEELGMIPGAAGNEPEEMERGEQAAQEDLGTGVPWFENMVSGSKLARMQRTTETKRGSTWSVEWEVVEWTEEDNTGMSSTQDGENANTDKGAGKRKLDDSTESDTIKKGWNEQRG
jgi:hypothetical protein